MKIATWNIQRPTKASKRIPLITDCLKKIDADILILTESNEAVYLGEEYQYFHTTILSEPYYKEGERRSSIYSKYPLIEQFVTYEEDTSICTRLKTPFGDLAIYGTVIGINGNRRKNFETDLMKQIEDFERVSSEGNLCIAGDLNISFGDNYYFTTAGRNKLNESFNKLNLTNLTSAIPENIDHIIISQEIAKGKSISVSQFNSDKKLSDHIGVCVNLEGE
jgi:endonuclease/exonuclease/phosphatase family metal-dependent hydrolase